MQEYTTPSDLSVDDKATTVDAILRYRAERPTMPLFKRRSSGTWITVTAKHFADEVDAVAKGLIASGSRPATGSRSCPPPATSGRFSITRSGALGR